MGEGKRQVFEGPKLKAYFVKEEEKEEDQEDQGYSSASPSPSCSSSSFSSFSTMEDEDDDASSSSSPNSTPSSLNDFSQLMAQLPIKRGLSKFYNGKSESFTNLARVTSIEDLAKKENPYDSRRRLLKACKSHGCGLDSYKSHTSPKPIISKKNSFSLNRRPSFVTVSRPPPVPY